jgi:hypothetical protein
MMVMVMMTIFAPIYYTLFIFLVRCFMTFVEGVCGGEFIIPGVILWVEF